MMMTKCHDHRGWRGVDGPDLLLKQCALDNTSISNNSSLYSRRRLLSQQYFGPRPSSHGVPGKHCPDNLLQTDRWWNGIA